MLAQEELFLARFDSLADLIVNLLPQSRQFELADEDFVDFCESLRDVERFEDFLSFFVGNVEMCGDHIGLPARIPNRNHAREQLARQRRRFHFEEFIEARRDIAFVSRQFVGFDELIGNVFDFGDESVALEKRQNAHTTDAVDEHRIRSIGHASHAHDMPDTAHFRQIIGLELHRVVVFVFDFAPQEAQIIAMRLGALDELEHRAWRHDNWHHHIGIYDRLG